MLLALLRLETFLVSQHASANLCTFGARLSVATHFRKMLEEPHAREQAWQPHNHEADGAHRVDDEVPLSGARKATFRKDVVS